MGLDDEPSLGALFQHRSQPASHRRGGSAGCDVEGDLGGHPGDGSCRGHGGPIQGDGGLFRLCPIPFHVPLDLGESDAFLVGAGAVDENIGIRGECRPEPCDIAVRIRH